MKILGAKVIPATHGLQTLKEAVDSAFEAYLKTSDHSLYCIGSVVGPHPFPWMVREFQSIVGIEAKEQFEEQATGVPDHVVACCGGGSNSMGIFAPFIDYDDVKLYAVEPLGKGTGILGDHAASLKEGSRGTMHGFSSIMLKNEHDEPASVHSVASGLDYPSVGPEHAFLFESRRTERGAGATDDEAIDAFFLLSRFEGIIPALETSHAIAYGIKLAKELIAKGEKGSILINVSGRGDKDLDYVLEKYSHVMNDLDRVKEEAKAAAAAATQESAAPADDDEEAAKPTDEQVEETEPVVEVSEREKEKEEVLKWVALVEKGMAEVATGLEGLKKVYGQ